MGQLVGNIVGMAYVVARPKGRFEIRESVHTPKGPRARSLANFAQLTDEVLATARRRATRPFDAEAVAGRPHAPALPRPDAPAAPARRPGRRRPSSSSPRAGWPVRSERGPPRPGSTPGSRRRPHRPPRLRGPGQAVRSPRAPEPLRFPPLARLAGGSARGTARAEDRDGRRDAAPSELGDLAPKIVSLHEMLDSAGVPHQFGGAIALAWYRNPGRRPTSTST